jgi:hypothetical protein
MAANPPKITIPRLAATISFSAQDETIHSRANEKIVADSMVNVKLNVVNLLLAFSL